jgi:Flp pilus assembly protein TadG
MERHLARRPAARPAAGRPRGGIATIELALALVIVFPLLFGLIEYGWMFLKSQQIAAAARDGARIAATESGDNALVAASIQQALADAGLAGSGYSIVTVPANVASVPPGTPVKVTVSVPYSGIALTNLPFIPTPANLKGTTSMVKEGP